MSHATPNFAQEKKQDDVADADDLGKEGYLEKQSDSYFTKFKKRYIILKENHLSKIKFALKKQNQHINTYPYIETILKKYDFE